MSMLCWHLALVQAALKYVLEPVPSTQEGFTDASRILEMTGHVFSQPWVSTEQKLALLHVSSALPLPLPLQRLNVFRLRCFYTLA